MAHVDNELRAARRQAAPVTVRVVQLRFHWTERAEGVVSVDFHPTTHKLLTAGCDGSVKVWNFDRENAHDALTDDTNDLQSVLKFASVLTSDDHPTPNVARWSPAGNLIVAAYVLGEVIVWKPADATAGDFDKSDERSLNTEHWGMHRVLKLPSEAVDARMSPCSRYVISCCIEGTIYVHMADTGTHLQMLSNVEAHETGTQHVAFDPLMQLASSYGADRTVKFYKVVMKKHGAS